MGPKQKKKEKDTSEKEEIVYESFVEEPVQIKNDYYDLRYEPQPVTPQLRRPDPRLEKILVLKKKRIPTCNSITQKTKDLENANPSVAIEINYSRYFSRSKGKRKEMEMENYVMQRTGKIRQSLLLRKQQNLPHIAGVGEEKTFMMVERTETPEIICNTDMFSWAAQQVTEKNGIRRTLTRQERGFKVVEDWVGYPEVTDFIAEKLRTTPRIIDHITSSKKSKSFLQETREFVPKFEELGLVGLSYEKVQQQLKEMLSVKTTKEVQKSALFSESSKPKHEGRTDTTRGFSEEESIVNLNESEAGLIFGQITLFWSRDPERSKKKWVIDLGCTAEIGKDAIGSVTMKNIGTTAIYFKWEQIQPTNIFNLKKYNLRRFAFDSWGSVILPGETFRLPVLYKCLEPGFYSEDWRFISQPVMENGAEIITRLWGITRQYDPYRRVRQEIDENLEVKMARAIVEHRVKKIVDYLPLKEVPLKDTRFPLVHLGPDLFHLNNPWLKYHCASVYRIGKLATMTENKKGRLRSFSLSNNLGISQIISDLEESVSDLMLSTKFTHSVIGDDLLANSRNIAGDVENDDSAGKSASINDDNSSVYSEGVASISVIKRLIEEQISPDAPILPPAALEPVEDDGDFIDTLAKKKEPLAVNLTNPDFSLEQIRDNILTNTTDSEEHKEALFLILSEQITRLLFRTDTAIDNWKVVVARSLFCNAMDEFSTFALSLKDTCCEAQLLELKPRKVDAMSDISEQTMEEEAMDMEENSSDYENEESEIIPGPALSCSEMQPRRALQYIRYQDQFYSRIYCRMYSLLSDYVEDLDTLLSEVTKLKLAQEEVGFTRVRKIPMNFSVEDVLNAPLPPNWVKLAQRIDHTIQRNRARKELLQNGS